ncbi:MAG: hypothetical protein B7Y51_08265 [Burkholderiales bacterium 28-67-8]|nr:MAG: hypothetical protein B7Y51_08265 [Burkholderiales bacterium 28-67-8]
MDNSDPRALRQEIEVLMAMQAGVTVILSSLIATHPRYREFQLHLTALVELADAGPLWKPLSDRQREIARLYVEELQSIHSRLQPTHDEPEPMWPPG